jgi:hypothetical protein
MFYTVEIVTYTVEIHSSGVMRELGVPSVGMVAHEQHFVVGDDKKETKAI